VIIGAVVLHLVALHRHGSSNPLGIERKGPQDSIPFHPYYTVKDLYGLGVFMIVYMAIVFFAPNMLGESINYVPANPLVTPPHIVPEWYFLPYYAILRSIPDKLLGVIAMFASILILFVLPWLDTSRVRSARFRPIYKWVFWLFLIDCAILGWVGANPPSGAFLVYGRLATAYYFLHFLIVMPILGKVERTRPLPDSISAPVLGRGNA
jgi:quinol-cytochrome oxidoreductase complex cytochrome b subunit